MIKQTIQLNIIKIAKIVSLLVTCVAFSTTPSYGAIYEELDAEGNAYIEPDGRVRDDGSNFYFTPEQGTGLKPVITTLNYEGTQSVRFQTQGSTTIRTKDRSEISIDGYQDMSAGRYVAFAMYIPSNFQPPTDWFTFCQYHQQAMGSPPLSLSFNDDGNGNLNLRVVTRYYPPVADTYVQRLNKILVPGSWYRFVIKTQFNFGSNGVLKVWINNVKELDLTNIQLGYANTDPYGNYSTYIKPKIGIYRGGGNGTLNHWLAFDALRFTNSLSQARGLF